MMQHMIMLIVFLATVLLTNGDPINRMSATATESPRPDDLTNFINLLTNGKGMVGCYWTICCESWHGGCTRWYRCCVGSILPDDSDQLSSLEESENERSFENRVFNPLPSSMQASDIDDEPNRCWTSGGCTICCYPEDETSLQTDADDEDRDNQGSYAKTVSSNKLRVKSFYRKMRQLQSIMGISAKDYPNDCISRGNCILCCNRP